MAGLYGRMVDPNFAAPGRGGVSPNAGLGVPGSAGLMKPQEDNFDAASMAGLLGLAAKQQKDKEAKDAAAANAAAAATPEAQPGMAPVTNQGNFDMAPAMAGDMPNGGGFTMPPAGSGDAFQLGNVGGGNPLMSNFGGGIPAAPAAPAPQGMAMPASIGGAGVPTFGTAAPTDPGLLSQFGNWFSGLFSGGAGA